MPANRYPAHGLFRITAASPPVAVGDPQTNVRALCEAIERASDADLVLLPELAITGYTCADLFGQAALLEAAREGLHEIAAATPPAGPLVVVGLPLTVGDRLMNVAAVCVGGNVVAAVPKQFLPTYKEFYEGRWFAAGSDDDPPEIELPGQTVPFGIDLLIRRGDACLGIEICEDLWTPTPPSGFQALAGANILLNLSASNENIGKASWRHDLVVSQSGRCLAAYAYASAGPTESTTDLVFGGHCLIAENGTLLAESQRIGDGRQPWPADNHATCDVDLQRLEHDRQVTNVFSWGRQHLPRRYREIRLPVPGEAERAPRSGPPQRPIAAHPFVPTNPATLAARCSEIFGIQMAGLAKRVSRLPPEAPLVIGVSGGLDSTLALLVAIKACDFYGWPRHRIDALTMPGFGTTTSTRRNAGELMGALHVQRSEVDIRPLCLQAFAALDHAPLGLPLKESEDVERFQQRLQQVPAGTQDLVFENVQARMRTFVLMNRGFVLGTGDLSEQALGWSTYNGDHMSMYNVNTSIPKTLVRFLVRYAADHYFEDPVRGLLHAISSTPISPELLPPAEDGSIGQETEQQVGAYELHDFFLYHVIRFGFSPAKILHLARHATFERPYEEEALRETLDTFYRRFFQNQFKRSCVPDGPKVGTVSLSPRGDWRMPSDADRGPFGVLPHPPPATADPERGEG